MSSKREEEFLLCFERSLREFHLRASKHAHDDERRERNHESAERRSERHPRKFDGYCRVLVRRWNYECVELTEQLVHTARRVLKEFGIVVMEKTIQLPRMLFSGVSPPAILSLLSLSTSHRSLFTYFLLSRLALDMRSQENFRWFITKSFANIHVRMSTIKTHILWFGFQLH